MTLTTGWRTGVGDDPEVHKSKANAALARFVSLHPTALGQRAEIIVEHFRQKVAGKIGGHAKAMVVTRSRLHAVRYKEAIDSYIRAEGYHVGENPLATLVAFSGTVTDPDSNVSYTEPMMNGFPMTQLPARFESDDFQVLVVAEKYQTGFDQPLLHTMYVDKQLHGVKAVQTLSRLNRIHPEKTDTFILDFENNADDIQESFRPFFEESTATPTDPNVLYAMRTTLLDAHVLHPAEMSAGVAALLSGEAQQQQTLYKNLDPAVERFAALDEDDQDQFRSTLTDYIRAYSFLAQVMPWTDSDLEELYLYGKALSAVLPRRDSDPIPQLDDSVILTHLRISTHAEEEDRAISEGETEPGVALPGGGAGRQNDPIVERLSQLIEDLNAKYGTDLDEADKIWFDQQKQALKADEDLRTVAIHNDKEDFVRVLAKHADDAIVDRHESNGQLFNAYFEKPGFRDALLGYLADAYEEIREEQPA